ncbi:MAG TPA: hypothetical protein PLY30_04240, partial [Candidatus Omnitrophota bacterium]|nr:hypothetical protein [Candidatus Omnitrophota bacterium]
RAARKQVENQGLAEIVVIFKQLARLNRQLSSTEDGIRRIEEQALPAVGGPEFLEHDQDSKRSMESRLKDLKLNKSILVNTRTIYEQRLKHMLGRSPAVPSGINVETITFDTVERLTEQFGLGQRLIAGALLQDSANLKLAIKQAASMTGTQLTIAMPQVSVDIARTVGYYALGDKFTVELIRADFNFSLDRLRGEKMRDEQVDAEIFQNVGKIKDLQDEQAVLRRMLEQEKALLKELREIRENRAKLLAEIESQPELVRYRDRQWVTAVTELENARDKETGAELGVSLLEARLMDPDGFQEAVRVSLVNMKEALPEEKHAVLARALENFGLNEDGSRVALVSDEVLTARARELAKLVLPKGSTDFKPAPLERVMDAILLSMRYRLQTFVEKAEADELDAEAMNVFSLYATAALGYGFGQESYGDV